MPLPAGGNEPWPPKHLDPVYQQLAAWSAWYSGVPDRIAEVYGGQAGQTFDRVSRQRVLDHPSQYRGGIVGKVARWFWGAPTPFGQLRTKLHVPLAGDIASKSSKLLFSEPPALRFPDESGMTKTQDRLDLLVNRTIHRSLLEAGETCAAIGGTYLRIVWDDEVRDHPWLTAVQADSAVPEWRWDTLAAVTFWRVIDRDGTRILRHLERHSRGGIEHGLYEGNAEDLGRKVDLGGHAETQDLDDVVETEANGLTAAYVPNMTPARCWPDLAAAANLGRSDYQGSEGFLDALDETWSSWMRDIRLGRGRVHVPAVFLDNLGPGQGALWDAEREVYATLNALPGSDGNVGQQMTVSQFAIRVEEHSRTARELTNVIVRGAGYSEQSFGEEGDVAITATEVTARERDSFQTRGHKQLLWAPALAEIVETLLQVDAAKFRSGVTPARPDIEWPDGVADDPERVARTLQLLAAAEAASTETKVRRANPDWDDDQVMAEVARIKDETSVTVTNPDTFTGDPAGRSGDEPDDEQPPEDQE